MQAAKVFAQDGNSVYTEDNKKRVTKVRSNRIRKNSNHWQCEGEKYNKTS